MTESESVALPLGDSAICFVPFGTRKEYITTLAPKMQEVF